MPKSSRVGGRRKRPRIDELEAKLAACAMEAAAQQQSGSAQTDSQLQSQAELDWQNMVGGQDSTMTSAADVKAVVTGRLRNSSAAGGTLDTWITTAEEAAAEAAAAEAVAANMAQGGAIGVLAGLPPPPALGDAADVVAVDAAALSPAQHAGENAAAEAAAEAAAAEAVAANMAQGGAIGVLAGLPPPPALGDAADVVAVAADEGGAAANADGPFPGREDGRMPIGPGHLHDVMEAVRLHFTQGVVARPVRVVDKAKKLAVVDIIAARMAEATSQLASGADFHAQQAAMFALLRVPGDLQPAATRADRQGGLHQSAGRAKQGAGKGYEGLPPDMQHVVKAMRSGDMSKAGRLLQSPAQVSELTAESLHLLATKHPLDAGKKADMAITPGDQVKVAHIRMTTLKSVVFGTPNGRAAGPSGWTFELLKLTMSSERGKQALLELVQQLAVGGYAHNSALMTCSLTVLGKKGGGVRPIAVAEPIVSVVSKCLAREVKEKIATHFRGHQFAGGMKHGIDAAIIKVKHALIDRPGSVVMSVDIANAFNEGYRGSMWQRTKAALPEVLPWVAMLYGQDSPLHMRGVRILHSRAGQRQGDALSMLLFCITLQPALEQAEAAMREAGHSADVAAYADDVKVVGSREACDVFLEHFESSVAAIGLRVNRSKTEYYDPQEEEGTMLFGAPIGTAAYVHTQAQSVLDECQRLADKCILLAEEGFVGEADQLLRRCIRAKAAALLRVTELPSEMLGAANTWLITSLRLILGIPRLGWEHTATPPSAGGLACPKLVNTARAAEANAKKQLHGLGFFVSTESTHAAFMAMLPSVAGVEPVDHSVEPAAPTVVEESGTRTAEEKRKAGTVFAALPQWIMSAAQSVPGNVYKVAIRVHLGMARMPVGLAAAHLRRYAGTAAAWENLRLATKLPNPHHCKEVRCALRGCGSFIRTRLSFALLFDVAKMAASHHQWLRRKQQGAGRL